MRPQASQHLYIRAQQVLPGGVNSPVRSAYQRVFELDPIYVASGYGAYIQLTDGRMLIDYCLGYGPLILGHAHPEIVQTIADTAETGTCFGMTCEKEVQLAEVISSRLPGFQKMRFLNSGTEAAMLAIRLARAATGRQKIVKFDGCYHGHADPLLVQAGSGVATLGLPNSPGVPPATVADTLVMPYNDLTAVQNLMQTRGTEIAAILVEPVLGNVGCIPPRDGFLAGLRHLCDQSGSLLVFDEVMTGFRIGPSGALGRFHVRPDLIILGKVIGGGLPIGACCGSASLMDLIAPAGPVYQAGTFSGNPLAMAAGLKTLEILQRDDAFTQLNENSERLAAGLRRAGEKVGVPLQVNQIGAMLSLYFCDRPVTDYTIAKTANQELFKRYYRKLIDLGVHLAPSAFESSFLSIAHTQEVIEETVAAHEEALRAL
ncbi:MAG: Glutamate-1-semialdehyde 2,1-aminomutase [Phycisphaerae bacterium]|nr:Glutamate-1-semialdehyde 2,1-aminomutase [Phycisphaerae bacterium]